MKLTVVVPCYNEEAVLHGTCSRVRELIGRLVDRGMISPASNVCFVDDGSKDSTWSIIESLAAEHGNVTGIKLSRNTGHQHALLAGLLSVEADAVVSLDADLQDDVEAIVQMVEDHSRGFEIVYGVRSARSTDGFLKRTSAEFFYWLVRAMGVEVIANHADFRLMGRKAIEALRGFEEVHLFLRGIIPLIGFRTSIVYYERAVRFAGTSKYSLGKMLALAADGITSFSVVPLRIITILGMLTFLVALMVSAWVLVVKLFTGAAVPGWASTVLPIYVLGGIQILCIGVIGEYLGKIYGETKARPKYIIEKRI